MDVQDFISKSQDYLSAYFYQTKFDVNDSKTFELLGNFALNNNDNSVYLFTMIEGYKPNLDLSTYVYYSFFILVPENKVKDKFLAEVNKRKLGQPYNDNIISNYYLSFTPARADFQHLTDALTKFLKAYIKGSKYDFVFNLVTPTADYNMALVYLDLKSVGVIDREITGKVRFDILSPPDPK